MKTDTLTRIITSFTLYKFLDALTTPFEKTAAYKKGIIDARGNQIKPDEKLTLADKAAFTDFDRLVISLRRLIMMVPDPYVRTSMNNGVPGILNLVAEECESMGGDKQYFIESALREMKACRLVEEGEGGGGIANSMGGGFATTSNMNTLDNPQGNLAGYDPPLATGKKIFRRKKPNKYYMDRDNAY